MCGIAGFYDTKSHLKENHFAALQGMEHALKHRGPDGYGYWLSDDLRRGLIQRRLSIQDQSFNARQPFHSADNSIILSFNGEIYNHPELSVQFKKEGFVYRSNSDTETLIFAYQKWGIGCLEKLNGMFAFALFDQNSNELFLVRDRFGIKPLYFSTQAGILSFASEIKALETLPFIKKEIIPELISHYLSLMITPAPLTLFKEIYKLPAGWYIKQTQNGGISFTQWYSPITALSEKLILKNESEAIDLLDEKLQQSVKKMLLSDRPVGVFLSGGLDSSLIVALMSLHQPSINTFSVGYESWMQDNELAHAKKIADLFSTNHHEIILDEKSADELLDKTIYHLDEPHADPVCIPFSYVSKLAQEKNTPVVLAGEGADELLMGYNIYQKYHQLNSFGLSKTQSLFSTGTKNFIAGCARKVMKTNDFHDEILTNWQGDRALFWTGALPFTEPQKKLLFKKESQLFSDPILEKIYPGLVLSTDTHSFIEYHRKQLLKQIPNASLEQEMVYLELIHRLPELLLMRTDKMSMMHGIEARVPYLDHVVAEFALQLPTNLKIGWNCTKYLLKKVAERYLPKEIVYRKKQGFSLPLLHWFESGEYFPSRAITTTESHGKLLGNISTEKMSLYNTEKMSNAVQRWSLLQLSLFEKML